MLQPIIFISRSRTKEGRSEEFRKQLVERLLQED